MKLIPFGHDTSSILGPLRDSLVFGVEIVYIVLAAGVHLPWSEAVDRPIEKKRLTDLVVLVEEVGEENMMLDLGLT